jgi:hypothetical protein
MDDKKEKGFVIKDKRIFDESGDMRGDEINKEEASPAGNVEAPSEATNDNDGMGDTDEHYPEVNFASFVLSLSTSAMYHFGDFPNPESSKTVINLPAAKQSIDILTMLRDKTVGNLDDGEKSLIEGMLFELKMRYVKEKAKG